ncbi:MAG: folate-binding protein YgfZ [Vicinamibacterales bacterium]
MFSEAGYRALTTGCGYVRRADRGVLRVAGADRVTWLQGLLTNDVAALGPGEAGYAAYLTPQGRMTSDMRVVALPDAVLMDVPSPLAASLRERLEGLVFAEDVHVDDLSSSVLVVDLHGPSSSDAVEALKDHLSPVDHVVRDRSSGATAWAMYVPRDGVPAVVDALAELDVLEVSLATLEVVRIEAGIPRFLVDMREDTIPLEAGIEDRAISFTKGCYVGQEIIVRVVQRGSGRVARRLVGFAFSDGETGLAGDRVVSAGRDVGRLTSVAWSPTLGHAIALGYVHRDFVEPGTGLEVVSEDRRVPATVAALPFVRRES